MIHKLLKQFAVACLYIIVCLSYNGVRAQTFYPVGTIQDTVKIFCFYKDTINNETYIGGYFRKFNGVVANSIIKWDGQQWLPVGDGFNRTINVITMYKGVIVAGGEFDSSGTTRFKMPIAQWTGTTWIPFDTITNVVNPHFSSSWPMIRDMKEFDNRLFVIGEIRYSGPFPGSNNFEDFAFWNDTLWKPAMNPYAAFLSAGMPSVSMVVFQNELYIGSADAYDSCSTSSQLAFIARGLMKYNPICLSIEQIGSWGSNRILGMLEFNGSLYLALYSNHPQYGKFVTRFDGTNFYPVGAGLNEQIQDFTIYNGQLCAVGSFTADGNNSQTFQSPIAIWDGANWNGLPSICTPTGPVVFDVGAIDSLLFVGGYIWPAALGNCGTQPLGLSATYPNSLTSLVENIYPNENLISIAPNPSFGDFLVTATKPINDKIMFDVFDLLGERVFTEEIDFVESSFNISLSYALNQGVYFYRISTNKFNSTGKIIIYEK